jgi:coenzyme F420-reducing hydrogenase gamma subunit
MRDFGKGPTLIEASRYLRDDQARIERILTVTETDSVIEGLPPFSEGVRQQIRKLLKGLPEQSPERIEQSRSLGGSPS